MKTKAELKKVLKAVKAGQYAPLWEDETQMTVEEIKKELVYWPDQVFAGSLAKENASKRVQVLKAELRRRK